MLACSISRTAADKLTPDQFAFFVDGIDCDFPGVGLSRVLAKDVQIEVNLNDLVLEILRPRILESKLVGSTYPAW